MDLATYAVRRLLLMIPMILGATLIVFIAMYLLPGDVVDMMLADAAASAEDIEMLREQLGLNDPFLVQYGRFLSGAVRGDFGISLSSRRQVMRMILGQLPATLRLGMAAFILSIISGVTMGVIAGVRRGSWVDTATMGIALAGVSIPVFWTGLMMIFIFSLRLGWFPSGGSDSIRTLIMPAVALSMGSMGLLARLTRSSMLEVMGSDYIRTARSKGLSERVVTVKHALRNAMIPIVTIAGLALGRMMGGTVLTEVVFSRQGVGYLAARAVQTSDFPVVQGTVTVLVVGFLVANLIVDLTYGILDPRIRYE